jgi:hypothetical protein
MIAGFSPLMVIVGGFVGAVEVEFDVTDFGREEVAAGLG